MGHAIANGYQKRTFQRRALESPASKAYFAFAVGSLTGDCLAAGLFPVSEDKNADEPLFDGHTCISTNARPHRTKGLRGSGALSQRC